MLFGFRWNLFGHQLKCLQPFVEFSEHCNLNIVYGVRYHQFYTFIKRNYLRFNVELYSKLLAQIVWIPYCFLMNSRYLTPKENVLDEMFHFWQHRSVPQFFFGIQLIQNLELLMHLFFRESTFNSIKIQKLNFTMNLSYHDLQLCHMFYTFSVTIKTFQHSWFSHQS